jgi:hypothetical protein
MLAASPPDLLITDVVMPGLVGWGVFARAPDCAGASDHRYERSRYGVTPARAERRNERDD